MTEAHTPLHHTDGDVWIEGTEVHMTTVCCRNPMENGECCNNPVQEQDLEQTQELLFRTTPELAALIVTAVNCHSDLVEALKTARNGLIWFINETGDDSDSNYEALEQIDLALSKAGVKI